MQTQSFGVSICLALAALGLAGGAVGCGDSNNPTGPSVLPGVGAVAVTPSSVSSGGPAPVSSADGIFAAGPELAASHEVPFKGSVEGLSTLTFPSPLSLSVTAEGTGNATQLGRYTFEYHEVVNLSTNTGTGTYEFTAANGDTLTGDFTGVGFPTADPNVLSLVEDVTITGGTGRFAGATGSFQITRSFDFATNLTTGSFEGTIRRR